VDKFWLHLISMHYEYSTLPYPVLALHFREHEKLTPTLGETVSASGKARPGRDLSACRKALHGTIAPRRRNRRATF
jgi:hypothetical protein